MSVRRAGWTLCLMASLLGNAWLYRSRLAAETRIRAGRSDLESGQQFAKANAELRAEKHEGVRIVLAGDSDIALWDPLPALAGGRIVNRGWGGDRTGDLLVRLERDVVELQPDIAVLTIGGNDLEDIASFPDREAAIVESCERNIRVIIDALRRRDIPVVLLTILPYGDVPPEQRSGWSDGTYRGVARVNAVLRGMEGPGVHVLDCDSILTREDGKRKPVYSSDFMHLNPAGYRAVNGLLSPLLESLARVQQR